MAVAGQPEDASVRQQMMAPGHEQPIQQFKFGRAGEGQWIFYWYYTLKTVPPQQLDELQQAYLKLRQRPASLTLEVFASEAGSAETRAAEVAEVQAFVKLLDAATQPLVGSNAERGSHRLAVTVVPDNHPPATD
jgi:hypothetical protein